MDFKEIGSRIRRARKSKDYTQEFVSAKCGINSQQISQIETGNSGFTISTLVCLCDLLEVSADYILFGNSGDHHAEPILGLLKELKEEQKDNLNEVVRLFVDSCTDHYKETENT